MSNTNFILEQYRDVLTPKEVGKILGISDKFIYRLIKDGSLPAKKIGRIYRISKGQLIKYLEEK